MNFSVAQRYPDRYPKGGNVALLCEGDVAGYETSLLAAWTSDQRGGREILVDLWPCGTAHGIYSVADALGRSRPILAIEDRDYRSPEVAHRECQGKKKRREDRGVDVIDWRTWVRHEIENYFLDPVLLIPVMARAFGVSEEKVRGRLQDLIHILAVDQAAQYVLYQIRHAWTDEGVSTRFVPGLSRSDGRPRWGTDQKAVVAPDAAEVERQLNKAIQKGRATLGKANSEFASTSPGGMFNQKCEEWANTSLDDRHWRVDWSGKEILAFLRQWLAAEYGLVNAQKDERQPIDWGALDKAQAASVEREIEWALQPRVTREFRTLLVSETPANVLSPEIRNEWQEIADLCLNPGRELP